MAHLIKSFGMSRMTLGSCTDFHSKANSLIEEATPAALHIEEYAVAYKAATTQLESIVNRQNAYVATYLLKEKDRRRDNASGIIRNVVNAYCTSLVDAKREAAQMLYAKLSPYRNIRAHEYTKQTAEIKSMLALLAEAENAAAISTLGLTEEVAVLKEANDAFEEAFIGKVAEVTSRQSQVELESRVLKAEVNRIYFEITQIVNAHAIVNPSEAIITFIGNLNGLVGTYSRIAGSKGSGGSAPDGGGGNGGGENPDVPGGV